MMELHELQKMISIIHDKKPKCRGNLRVKVLLKSTHDYVRRSLIDDQLGNSESLETLLRNSGTVRETLSPGSSTLEISNQASSAEHTESDAMDCEETSLHTTISDQEFLIESNSDQGMLHYLNNISASIVDHNYYSLSNEELPEPENREVFKITNKNLLRKRSKTEKKYLKLTRALQKVIKQWDKLMRNMKRDNTYLKRHYHSVKKMRKLLLESKVCFKADLENQSFSQQQITKLYLKIIQKMLKQCDNFSNYMHVTKKL